MNKHYESKVRLHLQRSAEYLRHAELQAEGQGPQHMKGFGSLWSEIQGCWNTLQSKQFKHGKVPTEHDAEIKTLLEDDEYVTLTEIEQEPIYTENESPTYSGQKQIYNGQNGYGNENPTYS